MSGKTSFASLATFLLGATLALAAFAGASTKEKVRLAVGSRAGNIVYLQIDLARALGYFEQEGLDVNIHYFAGGTPAAEALVARDYDFSGNSIDHAFSLRTGGQDL